MKYALLAILIVSLIFAFSYFVPLLMYTIFIKREMPFPSLVTSARLIAQVLIIALIATIAIVIFSRIHYGFKEHDDFYSYWRGFKKYYMVCFELDRGESFNVTPFLEAFDKVIMMLLDNEAYLVLIKSCYREGVFRELIEALSATPCKLPSLKVMGARQYLVDQLNRDLPDNDYVLVVEGKPTLKVFKYPLLYSPRVMEVVKAELYRIVKVGDGVQIYKLPSNYKQVERVNATSSALIRLARPPLPTSEYGVLIGLDGKGKELRIDFNRVVHSLILGATGTGKTTLAYVIGKQLADEDDYILYLPLGDEVVDFGFTKVLAGVHLTVDLFKLLREEDIVNILSDVIIATFGYDYRMSPIQLDVLSRAVSSSNSVEEIISMIDAMYGSEREDVRSACLALKRRLTYINNIAFKRGGRSIVTLLKRYRQVSVDVSHLDDVARATLALTLLHYLLKAWRYGKLYIIIDEVHRITPVERNWRGVFERVMREGRRYGLRIIGITQSPVDVPKCVHDNVDIYFTFRLAAGAEYIANKLVDPDRTRMLILSLPNRECVVSYGGGWKRVRVVEAKTKDVSLIKLCQEYGANQSLVSSLILEEGASLLKKFIPTKENVSWLMEHKLFTEVACESGSLLVPTNEGLALIDALEVDGYDVLITISKLTRFSRSIIGYFIDKVIKYPSLAKLLADERDLIPELTEYFRKLKLVKEMLLRGEIPREIYDVIVSRYRLFADKLESYMTK